MNTKLRARIIECFGHQWKFAEAVGIHESQVSRVIQRGQQLSSDQAAKWSEALGCDPEELGLEVIHD
jgi:plasmid maintenance system antidote protein VapI